MAFNGIYEMGNDNKGRSFVPSKLRNTMGNQDLLYLVDRLDQNFLYLLPLDYYEEHKEELSEDLPSPLSAGFSLEDLLDKAATVMEIKMDCQGRVNLKRGCRELPETVCFIGVGAYMLLYLGTHAEFEKERKLKNN
jgi:DNA-binding transcriptional regulator/RsmH inhibitor MraZ